MFHKDPYWDPLLFNIFINDIFHQVEHTKLCNYADDNVIYAIDKNLTTAKQKLSTDFTSLTSWFYENFMVLNPEKCQFMCLEPRINKIAEETFTHGSTTLKNVQEAKVLGVLIDNRLNFKNHIKNLCKTVSNKLNCLARLSKTLTKSQRILLFNSFIKGQFNYCPLIWMFCS